MLIAAVTGVPVCFSTQCHLSTEGAGSGGEGLSLTEGGVRGAGLKPTLPEMLTCRTLSRSEANKSVIQLGCTAQPAGTVAASKCLLSSFTVCLA